MQAYCEYIATFNVLALYNVCFLKKRFFYYCLITYSSSATMHLYIFLGFYAFQSVFGAVIYNLYVAYNSYYISGFWCGKQNYSPHIFISQQRLLILF